MFVTDEAGNDVTDQFSLTVKAGDLTVSPRKITATSMDATKVYDGQALTNHNVVTDVTWGEGDEVTYDFTGSLTEVGSSKNEFTVKAANELTDLGNYEITYEFGTLSVTKAADAENNDNTDDTNTDDDSKKKKKKSTDSSTNNSTESSNSSDSSSDSASVSTSNSTSTQEGAVLGAKRTQDSEEEEAGVLGARRAGTDDNTDASRVLVVLIAAGAVATILATGKRRKETEE